LSNETNSTTLKQTKKDEMLNPWKPKVSYKPMQNFVKCSQLNLPLSLSTKLFRIICLSCKYF